MRRREIQDIGNLFNFEVYRTLYDLVYLANDYPINLKTINLSQAKESFVTFAI